MKVAKKQKQAAASLILLSNENATCRCVVCGESVLNKKRVTYDFYEHVQQYKSAERELVRALRKHCEEHHPLTWIWNVVPSSGIVSEQDRKSQDKAATLDGILHQAMYTAARYKKIPCLQISDQSGWTTFFVERLTIASCWIHWSSDYYLTEHPPLIDPCTLKKLALERLLVLRSSLTVLFSTPEFLDQLARKPYDFCLNLFQLYFVEKGRYRICPCLGIDFNQVV
jgi:hypothetical protein